MKFAQYNCEKLYFMSCFLCLSYAKGAWKLQEPPDEASDPSVLTGQNQWTERVHWARGGFVKRAPPSHTDPRAAD